MNKTEWRARARTLPPVAPAIAEAVSRHVERFLDSIDGAVLGYDALSDEVPLDVPVDAIARLDADGDLTIRPLDLHDVAVVLVPARIFDRDGFRLGRGGGHYDRLVPRLPAGVPVVGVTCSERIVERLPREPHDQPMTHLATEHAVTPV